MGVQILEEGLGFRRSWSFSLALPLVEDLDAGLRRRRGLGRLPRQHERFSAKPRQLWDQ